MVARHLEFGAEGVIAASPAVADDEGCEIRVSRQKIDDTCAENPDGKYAPLCQQFPRASTGRRLMLAGWIAVDRNPRTARVAVNHIWMRLSVHRSFSPSPSDSALATMGNIDRIWGGPEINFGRPIKQIIQ